MKKISRKLGIITLLTAANFALAGSNGVVLVPFENVKIPAGSKIKIAYDFDPFTQVLRCTQDDKSSISTAEFEYKGVIFRVNSPVTLNDNYLLKGHTADPSGNLVIENKWGGMLNPDGSIFVTCNYLNINYNSKK